MINTYSMNYAVEDVCVNGQHMSVVVLKGCVYLCSCEAAKFETCPTCTDAKNENKYKWCKTGKSSYLDFVHMCHSNFLPADVARCVSVNFACDDAILSGTRCVIPMAIH